MAVCMECGRKLRSQQSKEVGYGPVCYKRVFGPVCGSVMEIQKQVLLQTIFHIMKYQGKCRLRIL